MIRTVFSALCLVLVLAAPAYAADAPRAIAGIELGADVKSLGDKVDLDSASLIWNREYLSRADVKDLPGYKSGYVTYGNCKVPDRVVRIKLSYEDESIGFFNELLAALKKKYGKNPIWRGDAFGTLRTWKWSLTDEDGNDISLILMHYQGEDDTYTGGNSIRLAARNWMNAERECWLEKKQAEGHGKHEPMMHKRKMDFDWFMPH